MLTSCTPEEVNNKARFGRIKFSEDINKASLGVSQPRVSIDVLKSPQEL